MMTEIKVGVSWGLMESSGKSHLLGPTRGATGSRIGTGSGEKLWDLKTAGVLGSPGQRGFSVYPCVTRVSMQNQG
jgi:hypothetical protein